MNSVKRQSLLDHPLVVFLSLVLAAVFVVSAINAYIQKRRVSSEYTALLDTKQKREREVQDLERRLSDLNSSEGIEREARATMNLKKPGEEVIVIVDDNNKEKKEIPAQASVWERIKQWLGFAGK